MELMTNEFLDKVKFISNVFCTNFILPTAIQIPLSLIALHLFTFEIAVINQGNET